MRAIFSVLIIISTVYLFGNEFIHNYIVASPQYKRQINLINILYIKNSNNKWDILPEEFSFNSSITTPYNFTDYSYSVSGNIEYTVPKRIKLSREKILFQIKESELLLKELYNSLGYRIERELLELEKLRNLKNLYALSLKNEELNSLNIEKIFKIGELGKEEVNRANLSLNKKNLELELITIEIDKLKQSITTKISNSNFVYESRESNNLKIDNSNGVNYKYRLLHIGRDIKLIDNKIKNMELLPDIGLSTGVSYNFINDPVIYLRGSVSIPIKSNLKNSSDIYSLEDENFESDISNEVIIYKTKLQEALSNIKYLKLKLDYINRDIKILEDSIKNIRVESDLGAKTILQKISIEDDIFKYRGIKIEFEYNLIQEYLRLNYIKGRLSYEK